MSCYRHATATTVVSVRSLDYLRWLEGAQRGGTTVHDFHWGLRRSLGEELSGIRYTVDRKSRQSLASSLLRFLPIVPWRKWDGATVA